MRLSRDFICFWFRFFLGIVVNVTIGFVCSDGVNRRYVALIYEIEASNYQYFTCEVVFYGLLWILFEFEN